MPCNVLVLDLVVIASQEQCIALKPGCCNHLNALVRMEEEC